MDIATNDLPASRYIHYPREIAANVTLRAAARALVPASRPASRSALRDGDCVAITTACAALATRVSLIEFLAQPADEPRYGPNDVRSWDWQETLPDCVRGVGPAPSRPVLELAGDRLVESWRRWARDPDAADYVMGVAGALAIAAWCSWALGTAARARTRASYALDVDPSDPLAALVERQCRQRVGPTWS